MWDAEVSRSWTCLLLENKKQNMFTSENNLEFTRVPWIHEGSLNSQGERVMESIRETIEKKSEFLLILIMLKNVYRLWSLFKGSVKLDKQENIL